MESSSHALFPKRLLSRFTMKVWKHFTESRTEISATFELADLGSRLHWIEPGPALKNLAYSQW
jgi:hypothetical protein